MAALQSSNVSLAFFGRGIVLINASGDQKERSALVSNKEI
jgi:hypothetical protein